MVWIYMSQTKVSFYEILSCDTTEFQQLYKIYEVAFPLADEREPQEAFEQIFILNNDQRIQSLYGTYKEFVTAIRLGKDGAIIGGIVFSVTTSPAHISAGIPSSIQAVYVWLLADYRGIIPMRDITAYCRKTALETFGSCHSAAMYEPIIFFEVNNPLQMTSQQIDEDTYHSGIDPFRRYLFWQRAVSSMPLDFAYVQPRLRDDSEPVHYLDLFCTNELPKGIPAQLLLNHLKTFVSISVMKGRNASQDSDFSTMEQWLNEQETVHFIHRNSAKIKEIANLRKNILSKGWR